MVLELVSTLITLIIDRLSILTAIQKNLNHNRTTINNKMAKDDSGNFLETKTRQNIKSF
jgi:hypothetical protein